MLIWEYKNPVDFQTATREDFKRYDTYGFKVILTNSVDDIFLDVKGYDECWAYVIYEQRGVESAGVLAVDWIVSAKMAMYMAYMAALLAKVVTIYINGDEALVVEMIQALSTAGYEDGKKY
ncbi:thioredoxin reductase glit [Apiospora sp. TS-2023a]